MSLQLCRSFSVNRASATRPSKPGGTKKYKLQLCDSLLRVYADLRWCPGRAQLGSRVDSCIRNAEHNCMRIRVRVVAPVEMLGCARRASRVDVRTGAQPQIL